MYGTVDRETVYYPGCYVLGPDTTLVRFDASAHTITETVRVFTLDTIAITMRYSLVYFLRYGEQASTAFVLANQVWRYVKSDWPESLFGIVVKSYLIGQNYSVNWENPLYNWVLKRSMFLFLKCPFLYQVLLITCLNRLVETIQTSGQT